MPSAGVPFHLSMKNFCLLFLQNYNDERDFHANQLNICVTIE